MIYNNIQTTRHAEERFEQRIVSKMWGPHKIHLSIRINAQRALKSIARNVTPIEGKKDEFVGKFSSYGEWEINLKMVIRENVIVTIIATGVFRKVRN